MFTERSHGAGNLRKEHLDQTVTLCGWVRRHRDMGGFLFVDLADRSGICQLSFDPDLHPQAFEAAKKWGLEDVVSVRGKVLARTEKNANPDLPTGAVEVLVESLDLLSSSAPSPFPLDGSGQEPSEEVALKYRFLDLRRQGMQKTLMLRHKIALAARNHLSERGFMEIETPILTKPTPEGARDFLVPSRMHKGKTFALPQSPQLFKQILMVSGYERYFQVVKCFRDEDLRGDRQPEFTQIDIEMSFVDQSQVMAMAEGLTAEMFAVAGQDMPKEIPHMTYRQAMDTYGSDKPDPRFGMKFVDLTELATGTDFKVVSQSLETGGTLTGMVIKGGTQLSRKQIDGLTETAKRYGAGGLLWMKVTDEGCSGPMSKVWSEEQRPAVLESAQVEPGDLLLAVVGMGDRPKNGLGGVRLAAAKLLELKPERPWSLLWVTDFPAFEFDEDSGRYVALHHPFTSPHPDHVELLKENPEKVLTLAYDLVLNGNELAGGSIRIHQEDIQATVFTAIGLGDQEARDKFGFLLDALKHGAPPHGGIAFGLDRLVALLAGRDHIRDVIAFPKTNSGNCLMTSAPAAPDSKTLREDLGLQLVDQKDSAKK